MTEDLRQPTQKQVFDYVKALCIQKKAQEARDLIIRCANINNDEAKSVKGLMSDYIRQKTNNPIIHDMLKVEKAYFDLYQMFKEGTEQDKAVVVVTELKEILPLLNPEEKAFTHYYLAYCQGIADPECNKSRVYHLHQVIKYTNEGGNDGRLYSCALDISSLKIPEEDKYNSISLALKKTAPHSIYESTYKKILAEVGYKYYWQLSERMNNTELDYKNRNQSGRKALGLIDVFDMPELKKCSYKIKLLSNMENLQIEAGDRSLANKTAAKKQSFIYKSARIRKNQTGCYSRKIEYD